MNVIQRMKLIVRRNGINRNRVLLTGLLGSTLSFSLLGWSQLSLAQSVSNQWETDQESSLSAANSAPSVNFDGQGLEEQTGETADPSSDPTADPTSEPDSNPNDQSDLIAAWINDLKQSQERWIEVNLSEQRLTAWEGNTPVTSVTVSTGRSDEPTLPGVFSIQTKQEKAWMQGENYEIPNVPYTMFYSGNYAIHGTYWHNNFGTPVSNGCVNVPVDQAAWLFNWASIGTPVIVEP